MSRSRRNSGNSIMVQVVRREMEILNARTPAGESRALSQFEIRVRDKKKRLEVDGFFRGREKLLKSEFREAGIRKDWLRQSINAALSAAISQHHHRDGEWAVPQWETGSKLALDAHDALNRLLVWMGAKRLGVNPKEERRAAAQSITRVAWLGSDDRCSDDANASVESAALSLVDARAFTAIMAKEFSGHAQTLKTQNVGEPEKQAFVLSLAESWHFFCGKIHPLGNSTPFSAFVYAAWTDVGGSDIDPEAIESFSSPIRTAQATLKQREKDGILTASTRPFWMGWNPGAWWNCET